MEEFEYGELIEARTNENDSWRQRRYVTTVTTKDGKKRHLAIMLDRFQDLANDTNGMVVRPYSQIRKIQKPEHDLIDIEQPETIEQRMDKFEAILNGAIKHINEQIESIKNQLT
jgi:hypothetical protein